MNKILMLLLSLLSFSVMASPDPKEAYSLFKEGKAVIIDVREADELKPGMIDGADWFPLSKFQTDKKWKEDFAKLTQGKTIFLYCRTGNRSGKVQTLLKDNGIESENIGGFETLKNILPVKVPSK